MPPPLKSSENAGPPAEATARRVIEQGGWRLWFAEQASSIPELAAIVSVVVARRSAGPDAQETGQLQLVRRSRHATTYQVQSKSADPRGDLFVKYFDPPARSEKLKAYLRGSRAQRVERITALLTSAGFSAPKVLVRGLDREGWELLVTARAEGDGPLISLNRLAGSLKAKRALLRALGREVARLHGAGFIHGDLTPFNIRIAGDEPPRFAFLDNERTRHRLLIRRRRSRLRNLVQLGRFALPGLTRTDRLRFFVAYEAALHQRHSRSLLRAAATMLNRRMPEEGPGEPQQR